MDSNVQAMAKYLLIIGITVILTTVVYAIFVESILFNHSPLDKAKSEYNQTISNLSKGIENGNFGKTETKQAKTVKWQNLPKAL